MILSSPLRATLLALAALLLMVGAARAETPPAQGPIHQLRIYEIFESNKAAFHDRFRDHATRIMKTYDFKIVAMWEAKTGDRTEFVYLLEWPNRQVMTDRWAAFMADKEWARIKTETREQHGALVGDIQDRVLDLTPYSPARNPSS